MSKNCVASWTDPTTGRLVRQLTNFPQGAKLGYFRHTKMLADGRIQAHTTGEHPELILIEPDSGRVEKIKVLTEVGGEPFEMATMSIHDTAHEVAPGVLRFFTRSNDKRTCWSISLPEGRARKLGR